MGPANRSGELGQQLLFCCIYIFTDLFPTHPTQRFSGGVYVPCHVPHDKIILLQGVFSGTNLRSVFFVDIKIKVVV